MFTTHTATHPSQAPAASLTDDNPWLIWRSDTPTQPARLTVAELAECRCPDLCDRDHDNE